MTSLSIIFKNSRSSNILLFIFLKFFRNFYFRPFLFSTFLFSTKVEITESESEGEDEGEQYKVPSFLPWVVLLSIFPLSAFLLSVFVSFYFFRHFGFDIFTFDIFTFDQSVENPPIAFYIYHNENIDLLDLYKKRRRTKRERPIFYR